jgi:hypothetical protein
MCYDSAMKHSVEKISPAQAPFIKRMATIVFEANTPHKGNTKATISIADFNLSAGDLGVYTNLFESFFRIGEPIVSKSAQDIAGIMPPAVFMEALPRLLKARALSVTFWEHRASAPKLWRKVKNF